MLSNNLLKYENQDINKQNKILLDNACMCSNIYLSKTEEERKDLFKEFLPNKLEYDIVEINNNLNCECCSNMKKYDSNCNTPKQLGYNAYYIQSKFLGNEKLCCFRDIKSNDKVDFDNEGNYIKNLTCDPKFKPWLPNCKNSLNNFCNINGNIFKHTKCDSHCQRYPQDCLNIKKNICNNLETYIKNKTFCDEFCIQNEGECDSSITSYCNKKENIQDLICSCINANLKNNYLYYTNPKCFDIDCMIYGYTTKALKNTTKQTGCPKTSCQIIINSTNADTTLKNNYLHNYCGNIYPEISISPKQKNKSFISLILLIILNILLVYLLIK